MVADVLGEGFAAKDDLLLETDVSRRGTHLDDVGPWLDVPLAVAVMGVEAELL